MIFNRNGVTVNRPFSSLRIAVRTLGMVVGSAVLLTFTFFIAIWLFLFLFALFGVLAIVRALQLRSGGLPPQSAQGITADLGPRPLGKGGTVILEIPSDKE